MKKLTLQTLRIPSISAEFKILMELPSIRSHRDSPIAECMMKESERVECEL
jgi:hypothetical protein